MKTYPLNGKEYVNPVLVFAEMDQAEKANRQISYTKGFDMKATNRWSDLLHVDDLWCIKHPVTEGAEFLNRVMEFVDDYVMEADLLTVGEGEDQVQTLGEEAVIKGKCILADQKCYENILKGFEFDILGDGNPRHFGCNERNQLNIIDLKDAAMMVLQGIELPPGAALEYNTSSDECLEGLSPEQCINLWTMKSAHVYKHRKMCEYEKKMLKGEVSAE